MKFTINLLMGKEKYGVQGLNFLHLNSLCISKSYMVSLVNVSWFKDAQEIFIWKTRLRYNTVNTPDTWLQNDTKYDTYITVCCELYLFYMFVRGKRLVKLNVACWSKKKWNEKKIILPL